MSTKFQRRETSKKIKSSATNAALPVRYCGRNPSSSGKRKKAPSFSNLIQKFLVTNCYVGPDQIGQCLQPKSQILQPCRYGVKQTPYFLPKLPLRHKMWYYWCYQSLIR